MGLKNITIFSEDFVLQSRLIFEKYVIVMIACSVFHRMQKNCYNYKTFYSTQRYIYFFSHHSGLGHLFQAASERYLKRKI